MFGLSDGWLWAIAGVILLIAEAIAPGFFLIFIGSAAILTGLATIAFGLGLPLQLLMFVIAAGIAVYVGRRLEGRSATAVTAIDEHGGRVQLGDSEWTARGGPALAGDRVRIVSVDGNCLIVRAEEKDV